MAGQELDQVLGDADRAHSGAAAAVGDAEGLVQVQVADIGADRARRGQADLGVHVRAIHVYLPAVLVNDLADFLDAFFKHAVRAGVGDHQAREVLRVLRGLHLQVRNLHVALVIAGDRDDLHAGYHRRGRVGAVRRVGDEAGGPVHVAARLVIGPDREQTGVFAL